jgi:hypothetical protein
MILLKKFFILITVIIFLIIIWRLIIIRINLKKDLEGFSIPIPFLSPIKDNELSSIESTSRVTITNINTSLYKLPLRELCIKSSYNSACSGNFINLDMLQYVINRGVRYLDFEVFYIHSSSLNNTSLFSSDTESTESTKLIPVVATSVDPTYNVLNTENSILLDNVLTSAIANAFSSPCPNFNDPLFINLRIKSSNTDIYAAVAASLDNSIQQKIYNDPKVNVYINPTTVINPAKKVTKNTPISDILGKVIISIDRTIFPNYVNYTSICNSKSTSSCYDLKNYINIENGSQDMIHNFTDIISSAQNTLVNIVDYNKNITDVKTLSCIEPPISYSINSIPNPNYGDYILKYGGRQIVPYRFYKNDSNLDDYESFFNIHNGAFVPLSIALSQYMKDYQ